MGSFSMTRWTATTKESVLDTAVAHIENRLELIATSSTIHKIGLENIGDGKYWQGYVIYEA